jgi:hypothetical protein
MALANFWTDNVHATLAVEERFQDACFRVRYEDLVADPEATAAAIFEYLGVQAMPGITEACFSAERERFGPGDNKIWYTSQISDDPVGRGWSVPTAMIAPKLLGVMNELAGRLGYLAVDGDWGTTEPPADLRVPIGPRKAEPAEYWLVDLGQATVVPVEREAQDDSDWDVIGTLDAWEQVIDHRVNLSVVLRSCDLRYCDNGETTPLTADARIALLGQLLGLSSWQ